MELKTFRWQIKTIADDESGEFSGLASTYGEPPDLGGDVVVRGAFAKSIQSQGKGLPVLWQHRTGQPIGVGKISDAPNGLLLDGKLVMADPVARRAHAHMKAGSVRGLSIGYDPIKATPRNDGGRDLHEIRLHEISVVTLPMNQRAEVANVKSLLPALAMLGSGDLEDDDDLRGDLVLLSRHVKRLLPDDPDEDNEDDDGNEARLIQLRAIADALKRLA
jgi:HK97 family phage prohead protease